LGVFILVLAILIWRKDERRWLRWFGVVAVLGVAVQAVLGGEVVRQLLQYWLPVMHACFAQIVFAAVLGIAVFTSQWWMSDRPQLADHGPPSIQTVVLINVTVIFLQVVLGAGFRHSEIPVWPHIVGAFAVMATISWTAVALRKRFGNSAELSRARGLLHAMFGIQFALGFGAYWARLASEKSGPTSLTVITTVTHTVVGALLFAFSVLIALICFRLVPSGRELASTAPSQVAAR
jgi:heme A synthase